MNLNQESSQDPVEIDLDQYVFCRCCYRLVQRGKAVIYMGEVYCSPDCAADPGWEPDAA